MSDSPDTPQDDKPRGYVPVPGVIDLDAVDADARKALWGSGPADAPSGPEDEPPSPDDISPARVPPPAHPASPTQKDSAPKSQPQPAPSEGSRLEAAADATRVEPVEPIPLQVAPSATEPEAKSPGASSGATDATLTPTGPERPAHRWEEDTAYRTTSTPPPSSDATPSPPDSAALEPDAPDASPNPILSESLRPSEAIVQTAKEATKDRGRELVALVTEYGKRHLPETAPRQTEPDTGPPRLVGRIGQFLPVMRLVPWVLAVGFGASFLWDFDGVAIEPFGQTIELAGLLRILSISGMIGFLTNWLAITMLFQPREKRAIIPQGLIPAQRERVIYRLSDAISRELINADIIKHKIQESGVVGRYRDLGLSVVRGVVEDPDFRTDLKTLAQRYAQETLGSEEVRRELAKIAVDKVEQQAGQGLGGAALKLYRTFAEDDFQRRVDSALRELPQAVTPLLDRIDVALDAVPAKVEARADEIEEAATKAVLSFVEGFDIQAMIQEKARGFDEAQLEMLLKSTSNEQLNYIKYLGGILGVFGGLVIWRAEMLIVFVAVGLVLWALDEVLVRARRVRDSAGGGIS